MSCDAFASLITRDLDGRLDAAEVAQLEQHIAGCAACAGERAGQRRVSEALRALPRVPVRPGLADDVIDGVHARVAGLQQHRGLPLRLAAGFVLCIGLAGYAGWEVGHQPQVIVAEPQPTTAGDARYREFLRKTIGLDEAKTAQVMAIRQSFDALRDQENAKIRPRIEELDVEEKAKIWRALPPAAQDQWKRKDPGFVPPAPGDKTNH